MVLLFFGMFIVLFTCFSSRKAKKAGNTTSHHHKTTGDAYAGNGVAYNEYGSAPVRKKRFGLF